MGNRAVIVMSGTTKETSGSKLGLYVHNNGDIDNVKFWLDRARRLGLDPTDETYFWARFCQIICNDFAEDKYASEESRNKLNVGIGVVAQLDCNNRDNGVYYIDKNLDIVAQTNGKELEYNVEEGEHLYKEYKNGTTGSFHTALLDAWSKADSKNSKRLSIGFPELAYAIEEDRKNCL